jgi:predicted phage terminase large subunit-like protein
LLSVEELLEQPDAIDTELATRHLVNFIEQAWHVVEPQTEFKNNWHIGAIAEHCEAVQSGEIRNLLVNIPPRFMKSLIISVFWPVWSWIQNPGMQWLTSSYAHQLAIRDAVKSRRIINSTWFKQRWPHIALSSDQNVKSSYYNTDGGYRLATSVGGAVTGEGGHIITVDDPHNIVEIESEVVRKNAILWWDEAMSTRLNDPETGGKVIIMQRSHQYDLSGHVIEKGNYTHLKLPLEFRVKKKCFTEIGFEDPRTKEDELLWKNRVGKTANQDMKHALGSYGYAGQMQQEPSAREGNMFKIDEINYVNEIREMNVKKRWRSWDKAGTAGGGAYTVGLRMGRYRVPRKNGTFDENGKERKSKYFIDDIRRGQWSSGKREQVIMQTSNADGKKVWIVVEQEPGSGGKESAEGTQRRLVNRRVELDRPTGDKEDRADDFSVAVENGEVDILMASWTHELKEELKHFPASTYKDQVDCCSMAFKRLCVKGMIHIG